jgi:hypothetical protein
VCWGRSLLAPGAQRLWAMSLKPMEVFSAPK